MGNDVPACVALYFVRQPVAGQVKTRLARDLQPLCPDGARAAAELYAAFGQDVLAALQAAGFSGPEVQVLHDPPDAGPAVRAWLGVGQCRPQPPGDLGARMAGAFVESFAQGAEAAVLLGSDLPDLPPAILAQAREALADGSRMSTVLGPASDGGYFLVGFRRETFCADIFTDMPWSTPDVLRLTLERLAAHGRQALLLPPWHDVDTLKDLQSLAARLAGTPGAAPRTRAALRVLGLPAG